MEKFKNMQKYRQTEIGGRKTSVSSLLHKYCELIAFNKYLCDYTFIYELISQ